MISQEKCKHEKLTKFGKHLYSDGYHQMYRCTQCAKVIKGEVIEKSAIPGKENMQTSASNNPIKEGECIE